MERKRCANCTISIIRLRRQALSHPENKDILPLLRQWHPNRWIDTADHICHNCWLLMSPNLQSPVFGHQKVCVNCGRSLHKVRCHMLTQTSVRERHIFNVISEWILPNRVQSNSQICHPCWMRADKHHYSASLTSQATASTIEQEVDGEAAVLPPQPNEETSRPIK